MGDKQSITLQFWWDTATHSGQKKYGSLENLMRQTNLNWGQLNPLLQQEVTTLGEWWQTLGKYLYREGHGKGTGKEAMAKELTRFIPAGKTPFARTTLSEYIRGTSSPKYREYFVALFAITALPCFRLEGAQLPPPGERQARPAVPAGNVQRQIRFAESLAGALLQQLQRLAGFHPAPEQLTELTRLVEDLRLTVASLREQDEDAQLARRLNTDLGAVFRPKKQK